jgi:hypothetical protein
MYQRGNGTLPVPTTTTGGATAPTATSGPQIKQAIGNWLFQGCYTEATNGRALGKSTLANDSMTLESCAAFCTGSSMFGVEYGRECMYNEPFPQKLTDSKLGYCGNGLGTGSVKATTQGDCSFPCPGDQTGMSYPPFKELITDKIRILRCGKSPRVIQPRTV